MGSAAGVPRSGSGQPSESPQAKPPAWYREGGAVANTVGTKDLTWRELGDAVWLTAVTRRYWETDTPGADRPDERAEESGMESFEPPALSEPTVDNGESGPNGGAPRRAEAPVEIPQQEPQPSQMLRLVPAERVATAPASAVLVSDSLQTIRALWPLKRKVADRREDHVILDEDATAERAVQDGLWLPVTTPDTVRWLDLTLVVDAGPSMVLWKPTVRWFTGLLRQLGAFRRIQLWSLDTRSLVVGEPADPILRGGTPDAPIRSPAELVDRSGRRVMIVLTDCLGGSWRQNRVAPMLAGWAATMPVTVVHLLPQWLWARTGLDLHRARLSVPGPLRPNDRWHAELIDSWIHPRDVPAGAVPIPVVELNARWLGWWARLITAGHEDSADGTVLLASTHDEACATGSATVELAARQRVRDFVSVASPTAVRLATLVAAAPVTTEVVRLVQEKLLPDSGTHHLVELLVGGLLRSSGVDVEHRAWDETTFDFHEGVRQVLLEGARRSETACVVRLVAQRFGTQIRALERIRDALDAPDITPDPTGTADDLYYLALEGAVMRALSGPYLSRADRIRAIEQDPLGTIPPTTEIIEDIEGDMAPESPIGSLADSVQEDTGEPAESPGMGPPPPMLRETLTERSRDERVPPVWGYVPPQNINFTGREELLDQLSQRLHAGGTTAVLPSALHGMGGIGKTQMAVEYIYRHLDDYEIVWWIQAAQVGQVRKALTELAQQLDLRGSGEVHTAVPAVREALRLGKPYSRWLLVFDAAEDIEEISEYFPTNGPGQILITSRNPNWASVARPLEITVFDRDESVALLRKRGPDITDDEANLLADKLGDLPLAVEQAAAWRAETGMPVSEYLRLFDEKVTEIDTSSPGGTETSVAAAWSVSFDMLKERNPAAHQLLQVCAFFAPEPITRALFSGVGAVTISPDLDEALRDPMQLSRAIRDINRYSLAKIDYRNNTLQLHRLVQLVLRNRMDDRTRADMRHGAHVLLANFDPKEPKSSSWWARYQDVWPHVYASNPIDCDDRWARQLVLNLMQFLYFWGDHDEAADLAQKALDHWTKKLGETDSQVLEAASYLGLYLWALGRYPEAAVLNSRTLELRKQISGDNSEETITAELRVAVDVRTSGNFTAARDLNERIYQKAKVLYGDDDPITLQTVHDLAVSVRLCGDYQEAFLLDKKTSERRGQMLGYDSVDTLNTLSGMYMDRRELGDYPRARDEHERIAKRLEDLLGEDKADTLRRYAYLAVARRKAGKHDLARDMSKKAIELFQRRYGDDHPNAMACAIGYSIDMRQTGDLEGAEKLGEKTFERYRKNLGEDHPHTLGAAVDLAVTRRLRGDASGARQLNERSLERFRATIGPDHPYSIVCAIDLASDLAALDEPEAALSLGTDALERAERVLGEDHPTTLAASLNVALDMRTVGRTQDATTRYSDTLERYRKTLGEDHPGTIEAGKRIRANCDIDPLPS